MSSNPIPKGLVFGEDTTMRLSWIEIVVIAAWLIAVIWLGRWVFSA